MSSSSSNGFNSHGEDTMNLHGVVSFPMEPSFRNHESNNRIQPMFITSNQTNHQGLFSSSHSINSYQNSSHVSSSSIGFNNPFVPNYHMRNNMVSNVIDYSPMNNNPHFTRVSITQTITNRYTAIVPTSSLITSQNAYDHGINPTILNPSFYSQNFVDQQREISNPIPLNFVDNQREILNPTPINTFPPHQNFAFPRHGDHFSFAPEHHSDQHVPHNPPVEKRSKPTKHFDGNNFDGEYDGQTHSLPYEKYGPYTCPKCENVFDTSQKFASHVTSAHYKHESIEERAKRIKAKNKNKRKLNQMSNEESQEVQPENGAVEENGGNDNIASDPEASQLQLIVKEEPNDIV